PDETASIGGQGHGDAGVGVVGGQSGGGIFVVVVVGEHSAIVVEDGQVRVERRTEATGEDLEAHGFVSGTLDPVEIDVAGDRDGSVDEGRNIHRIRRPDPVVVLPFRVFGKGFDVEGDGVGATAR